MTTPAEPTAPETGTPEGNQTPTPAEPTAPETGTPENAGGDELAKWKALAKKNEADFKKVSRDLAALQQSQMSDQEKAITDAKSSARAEVLGEVGQKLAAAELRAAGVPADVLDDLNLGKFVDADGEVLADAVAATAAKFAATPPTKPPVPAVPAGPQGGNGVSQLTRDDLKAMSPEEIVKAQTDGRLDDLMGKNR